MLGSILVFRICGHGLIIKVRNMIQSVTYFSYINYIKSINICMKLIIIIMSYSGENLVLISYAMLNSAVIFRK